MHLSPLPPSHLDEGGHVAAGKADPGDDHRVKVDGCGCHRRDDGAGNDAEGDAARQRELADLERAAPDISHSRMSSSTSSLEHTLAWLTLRATSPRPSKDFAERAFSSTTLHPLGTAPTT